MRRPLVAELSVEERSLARRWLLTSGSLYSIVIALIVVILMVTSGADKATVTATSLQKQFSGDRSALRPYGALPNAVQSISIPACASPSCTSLRAEGAGRTE
jgi:hypothetical protein